MFVYNIKITNNKLFKLFIVVSILIMIILFSFAIYKIIGSNSTDTGDSCISTDTISEISTKNYTNILKAVHENIDSYIGKEIKFSGFVYRVYDLKDNQFVLARNMIISSDYQTVVVGFLCESNSIKSIEDGTWVEITGKIQKTDYHGDMPYIKINNLKEMQKPSDEYVYPPDDSYIPTSGNI